MKLLNVIRIFAFGLLLVNAASGQKLTKAPPTKQGIGAPRISCKGQPIPKGFVVVGYKVSTKCGENPELVIKRPAEAEIVCAGSPIPEGYHIANRMTSTDCSGGGKGSTSDALSIVSNGPIGLVTTSSPSLSYDRFEDVTKVQMSEELLYREDRHSEFDPEEIYISATYAYRGQTPGSPSSVTLFLRIRVLFDLGFDSVNFIADGQRFSFDTVLSNNKSDSVENRYGGYTTYSNCTYSVDMPVESFRRIASSSNVEVRAAGREFNLTGSAFSALRAFARGIQH
jgi:hypothetical protein